MQQGFLSVSLSSAQGLRWVRPSVPARAVLPAWADKSMPWQQGMFEVQLMELSKNI